MRTLVLALALAARILAVQSLQMAPGVSGSVVLPESSPYMRTDQVGQSMRFEFRMHGINTPAGNATIWQTSGQTFYCYVNAASELWCTDWFDTLDDYNSGVSIAGRTDIIVRVVRDLGKMRFWTEIQNVDGTGYAIGSVRIISGVGNGPSSGGGTSRIWAAIIPGEALNTRLAWLRWRSGAAVAGLSMPRETDAISGTLAAWEFEDNGNDSSGHGLDMGMNGPPAYITTPTYVPSCNAGVQQSFRAGSTVQLDGSRSMPLNNNAGLSWLWQQISGPVSVNWSSHTAMSPYISGLAFGTYVFQLKVTDSDGVSAPLCTVTHGAVATDASGVVLISNPNHAKFFGTAEPGTAGAGCCGVLRTGLNPWPYFDQSQKKMADIIVSVIDTHFAPVWDTPLSGTISVSNTCTDENWMFGNPTCSVVTGVGTQFQTDFCGGGTTPASWDTGITVWYRSSLYPGQTGRRTYPIVSCNSQTSLTLGQGSNPWSWLTWPDHVDPNTSGLQYSKYSDAIGQWWAFGPAPANYYDNVVALYLMYYQTGIDTYLNAARKLADRWWRWMPIDMGAVERPNTGYWKYAEQRSMAIAGMILRALDGRPEMWTGIRRFINFNSWRIISPAIVDDLRNAGYQMMWTSMAAIFDPDPSERASHMSLVRTSVTNKWTPYRQPDGAWYMPNGGGYNFGGGESQVFTGTANVVSGSKAVSGSGTNFTYTWSGGAGGCLPGGYIWFAPLSAANPVSPTGGINGEPYAYRIASLNSDTSITLVKPYDGATGARNFGCTPDGGWLATGVQPFMLGLTGQGLWWARQAALNVNDTALADTLSTYVQGVGNWIKNVPYLPGSGGVKYGAIYPPCETPDPADAAPTCMGVDGDDGRRINTAESFHALSMLYTLNPSSALKAEIDARYGVLFGKPTTGGLSEDSRYMNELDSFWLNPNSLYTPKWFGFLFGIGSNWSWPSARMGGLSSAQMRSVKVSVRFADAPLATRARLTVTDPQGNTTQTICSSSPCSISADARQGGHTLQIDLLNAANAVVLSGDPQPIDVQ